MSNSSASSAPISRTAADKVGLPPGKLVYVGPGSDAPVELSLIDFDQERLHEIDPATISDCATHLDQDTITWINVSGIHDISVIEQIGNAFGIHPLILEDVINTAHRPKLEEIDNHLFIMLKMIRSRGMALDIEQISLIVGSRYVIVFQERPGDVLDFVRERLREGRGRIRSMGADYLAYALVDSIVDHYFVVIEAISDEIEALEARVLSEADPGILRDLNALKRELIGLRKAVWPLREVISGLQRSESPLISKKMTPFLRDLYDHTIQIADMVETFRDLTSGIQDLYLSALSHRMNEVMKVLTIVGTIFIPLTFIAGIYGMNFAYMPELQWHYSYPVAMGLMLVVGVGLVLFFRKKGWL